MGTKNIPRSKRTYKGVFLPAGLNSAFEKACRQMGMNNSEFIKYCLMKVLSELSLVSEEMHKDERNNQN